MDLRCNKPRQQPAAFDDLRRKLQLPSSKELRFVVVVDRNRGERRLVVEDTDTAAVVDIVVADSDTAAVVDIVVADSDTALAAVEARCQDTAAATRTYKPFRQPACPEKRS